MKKLTAPQEAELQKTYEYCKLLDYPKPSIRQICEIYRWYVNQERVGKAPQKLVKEVFVIHTDRGIWHATASRKLARMAIEHEKRSRKAGTSPKFKISQVMVAGLASPIKTKKKAKKRAKRG